MLSLNVECCAFHASCFAFHAEIGQMRPTDGRLEQVDAELQGPDPGWSETLFDHRRTLVVENAFSSLSK